MPPIPVIPQKQLEWPHRTALHPSARPGLTLSRGRVLWPGLPTPSAEAEPPLRRDGNLLEWGAGTHSTQGVIAAYHGEGCGTRKGLASLGWEPGKG